MDKVDFTADELSFVRQVFELIDDIGGDLGCTVEKRNGKLCLICDIGSVPNIVH